MSDEHDDHEGHEHHHHPAVSFFRVGPTPEQFEQIRMGAEASAHETRAFLDGLDVEQLTMFQRILRAVAGDGEVAAYYVGMCLGLLDAKFKLCLACGKDHDQMLADMGKAADDHPVPQGSLPEFAQKITERDRNMQIWEVEPVTVGDMSLDPAVRCVHCGTNSVTLSDRMLRKPGKGGCGTCIEKEKWG